MGDGTSGYGKKERFQQSPTATVRYRKPTTKIVENVTQFIFDHKKQASVIPDNRPSALMEASSVTDAHDPHQTMNHSGKCAGMGPINNVNLGSDYDEPGLAGRIPPFGRGRSNKSKRSVKV